MTVPALPGQILQRPEVCLCLETILQFMLSKELFNQRQNLARRRPHAATNYNRRFRCSLVRHYNLKERESGWMSGARRVFRSWFADWSPSRGSNIPFSLSAKSCGTSDFVLIYFSEVLEGMCSDLWLLVCMNQGANVCLPAQCRSLEPRFSPWFTQT